MTPTKPLTDDQLDAMLVRFLDAQADVVGGRARGERITADMLRRRVGGASTRRPWILLAAALLLTSAAAVGLTVGAATLREATASPQPSSLPSAIRTGGECDVSMPGTWVVYANWQGEQARPTQLVVHEDGSVTRSVDPSDWEQGPLTIRILTQAGVELVRTAVADGIDGHGCATIRVPDARPHRVVARSGLTGTHYQTLSGFSWGLPYEPPLQAATAEHQQVVTALGERIEDLASWLPRDAWVDPVERPYVGQWLVDVMQQYRSPDSPAPAGPDPTGLDSFANPATFESFGRKVIGTPDGPPTAAMTVAPERCQVSDAEWAAEVRDELQQSGALPPTADAPGWRYTVPGNPSYDVVIQLVALRLGEFSCLDYSVEAGEPAPPPTPTRVDTPRTDLTLVCWWLDLSWSRPRTPRILWHEPCRR
jgi:hypothetical protein